MQTEVAVQRQPQSLVAKIAAKYGVDPDKMLNTLKATAFRQKDAEISNEQMMALLIVADQYGLNPFTKEIYAFPDKGGIIPIVGVDGWARIINEHPQFDGMEFSKDESECTCTIYRKDRSHPIQVTEYMAECRRPTSPWSSHPRRMLRHKAMIQCARIAFGFVGIHDDDEAERIIEASVVEPAATIKRPQAAKPEGTQPPPPPPQGEASDRTGPAADDEPQGGGEGGQQTKPEAGPPKTLNASQLRIITARAKDRGVPLADVAQFAGVDALEEAPFESFNAIQKWLAEFQK